MSDLILGEALEALIDHRGKTPKKLGGDFVSHGVPVASALLVKDGRLALDEARCVAEDMYRRWMPVPLKRHDVLLTSEAPLGRVALVPDDSALVLGQRLFGLRGRPGVLDSRFLFYALQTDPVQSELRGRATGTTVTGIRQSELVRIRIPAPSYPEQRAIAAMLGTLDDKIAVNERIAETCDALARAHVTRLLPAAHRVSLRTIATITMGSSPPGDTYNQHGDGLPFYQGTRDFGMRFPAQRVWCSRPARIAFPGATLVSVRAPVGRLNATREECCIGRGLAALTSAQTPALLYHTLAAMPEIWRPFESDGTVFGAINKVQLESLSVAAFDDETSRRLEGALAPLDKQVLNAFREKEALIQLRDTLLPKLISGAIRVRDAEKAVGDAI
ncbi:restriction endonuclease subunit S [Micromonospora echinaurantiaca]|uniref:restriction endonuclease subunit S n=1 Tax=Micromonospora echinaurantiaca TaxID=47857 RepID=UPI003791D013